MDAGMAAVGGRQRSQLGQHVPQQPASQPIPYNAQQYNEMVMRLPNPSSATKAMSISSLSTGMSKLFRRRNDGNAAFDEDQGADFSDVTDGANVLFNDLRYLHHQGSSTIPIIPTLGPSMASPGTQLNNIQYRKQMNLQKKLAYASGARANSIQTSMGPGQVRQGMPYDPRLMLLMDRGPGQPRDPRLMLLMDRGPGQPRDPRLMLLMGPGAHQPRDPRLMLMMLRPANPYQPSQSLNGSKTWLLTGSANGMRQMPPQPQFPASSPNSGWATNQDVRTNSLNGQLPQNQQMYQNQYSAVNGPPGQGKGQGQFLQHPSYRNNPPQLQQGFYPSQQNQAPPQAPIQQFQSPPQDQQYHTQGQDIARIPNFPQKQTLQGSGQYPQQSHIPNPIQTLYNPNDPPQSSPLGNPHYANRPSWAPMLGQTGIGSQQQSPLTPNAGLHMAPPGPIVSPGLRQNHSSDSLMEVVEEGDESKSIYREPDNQSIPMHRNYNELENPLLNGHNQLGHEVEDRDHDYNPHTLAPTRLMRLRKLNLFDTSAKEDNLELPEKPESSAKSQSPEETSLSNKSTFDGVENHSRLHRSSELTSTSSSVATQSRHLLKEPSKSDRLVDSSMVAIVSPELEPPMRSQTPPPIEALPITSDPEVKHSNLSTPPALSHGDLETAPLTISSEANGGSLRPRRSVTANTAFESFRQARDPPKLAPEPETPHLTRGTSRQLLASKSKSMFKRLSRKNTDADTDLLGSAPGLPATGTRPLDFSASRKASWSLPSATAPADDFHLTKEDLRIMTCNRELLEELLMVTLELAASIKREFVFEKQTRGEAKHDSDSRKSIELLNDKQTIATLQQKLNKEKQLRFISEEHALSMEHGQQPLALKISYEKAEMYQQLLAKNQQISELEERVEDLLTKHDAQLVGQNMYHELLEKHEEMVRNYEDLKAQACDADEREQKRNAVASGIVRGGTVKRITLQREELRQVVTELSLKHALELKACNERVARAEARAQELARINERLTHI